MKSSFGLKISKLNPQGAGDEPAPQPTVKNTRLKECLGGHAGDHTRAWRNAAYMTKVKRKILAANQQD